MEQNTSLGARLYRHIFKFYNSRFPEDWEFQLGLALLNGALKVERPPSASQAPGLWAVHQAVLTTQAALDE